MVLSENYLNKVGYYELFPKLIAIRKASNVSQREISRELHCSAAYVCKVEKMERVSIPMFDYYMDRFGGDLE